METTEGGTAGAGDDPARPGPGLARRLADGTGLRFDCPMCARVQKVRLADVLCESCGARLRLFDDAGEAERALASTEARSRHLRQLPDGLYVVAAL